MRANVDEVKQGPSKPTTQPTRITDEHRIGPWAPQEITKSAAIPAARDVEAFLSDLSCANLASSSEDHPGDQAPEYCSPEWLLDSQLGTPVDVWALACTIFELRTGVGLFDHVFHDSLDERDRDRVILLYTEPPQLGPVRSWLANLVGFDVDKILERMNEEDFDPALAVYIGHRLDAAATSSTGGDKEKIAMFMERLKVKDESKLLLHLKANMMRMPKAVNLAGYEGPLLAPDRLLLMSQKERDLFKDLMTKMLKHNPNERLDLTEVLAHGWFSYK